MYDFLNCYICNIEYNSYILTAHSINYNLRGEYLTDRIVEQYIQKHRISKANSLIFRDWNEFLQILYQNNGRVKMIIWYEYCRINEQQIGMGGYIDTENQGFMLAETQLFEANLQEKNLNEILEYISKIRKEYSNYNLFPEFYL